MPTDFSSPELLPQREVLARKTPLAELVSKVGQLTCETFEDDDPVSGHSRLRQIATYVKDCPTAIHPVELELRITEPSVESRDSKKKILAQTVGWTESPNEGAAREFHDHIAELNPEHTVISISTEGISERCHNLPLAEALHTSFKTMATNRLDFLEPIAEDAEVSLWGVSMGTVVGNEMALQNLSAPRVEIVEVGHHDPALVPPENVLQDMIIEFPGHVTYDIMRESALHPILAVRCMLGNSYSINPVRALHRSITLTGNALALMQGTPVEKIEAVVAGYPKVGVVAGGRDPLFQRNMWRELQREHPDTLEILVDENAGHASTINTPVAATNMQTVFERLEKKQQTSKPRLYIVDDIS
ncbi:MAG TPA: hypothetical protein VK983_00790 [Candidatus Limnocylindrales bacterium]|nr:hypothetical protein [Candidatus Limnocylindrales bacterium]